MTQIKRALISVSDKSHIVEFSRGLTELGIEIISTGGTAKLLADNNIAATEVADHTGFPEMMQGRVKTLHPKIHGGILARRGIDDEVIRQHDIPTIDMVVVNLYPFQNTVARADCTLEQAIENIDIGGPTMLRAAAKNHRDVAVIVDSGDYASILSELRNNQRALAPQSLFNLAVKAFEHTAAYDGAIANYLGAINQADGYPRTFNTQFTKKQTMRYGENPHQSAAFYVEQQQKSACVSSAQQLQGKELSFNNIADTDAALECVKQFTTPACVIVKHANPCGVAQAETILDAYNHAYSTDPTSAFGGIIAFNQPLDEYTARAVIERQFVEVIIAPQILPGARGELAKKSNIRVLECGAWESAHTPGHDYKRVTGGMLVQQRDNGMISESELKVVTQIKPTQAQTADLMFAWKVAKFVKSNAIVYAKNQMTIGVGAGQMSRVYSARIAAIKAGDADLKVGGSVMASDAFFPFRDGIDSAAQAGIVAVIQPGGSMRDDEVIAAANEHGIAMVFTGMRHFRH